MRNFSVLSPDTPKYIFFTLKIKAAFTKDQRHNMPAAAMTASVECNRKPSVFIKKFKASFARKHIKFTAKTPIQKLPGKCVQLTAEKGNLKAISDKTLIMPSPNTKTDKIINFHPYRASPQLICLTI